MCAPPKVIDQDKVDQALLALLSLGRQGNRTWKGFDWECDTAYACWQLWHSRHTRPICQRRFFSVFFETPCLRLITCPLGVFTDRADRFEISFGTRADCISVI